MQKGISEDAVLDCLVTSTIQKQLQSMSGILGVLSDLNSNILFYFFPLLLKKQTA